MDPITLAMLGSTAISGIGSILGGSAASEANQKNADIALMNYYAQERARQQAINESRSQQGEAHLGTTDAAGNRTYFVPGQGWVTDLTDTQQQIQGGTEAEQLRQLVQGASRAETVDKRAAGQRGDEAIMAEAAMGELRRARPADEDALRQMFLARGAETRNRAADTAGNVVAKSALRMGGGADAAELMQRARGASDQQGARQAGIEAAVLAGQEGERQFDAQRDKASNLYDYFRRASTSGTVAPTGYMPTGPGASSSGAADQGIINALGRSTEQSYVNPNMGWAQAFGEAGDALGAYGDYKMNRDMLDYYKNRYGGNTGVIS